MPDFREQYRSSTAVAAAFVDIASAAGVVAVE